MTEVKVQELIAVVDGKLSEEDKKAIRLQMMEAVEAELVTQLGKPDIPIFTHSQFTHISKRGPW